MGKGIPTGYYETSKDWSLATGNQHYYKQIYTRMPFPKGIGIFEANPSDQPDWMDDAYVAVINNGRICGRNGAVITPDDKLLWDVSLEWFHSPETHTVFQNEQLQQLSYVDCNVGVLTHQAPTNYYHWMYEVLPRVSLIRQSGLRIDRYVVHDNRLPFQIDTLRALGVNEKNIIRTSDFFHMQAKKLIVPSLPRFATRWACDFLRKELLPLGKERLKGFERIYIARSTFRTVLNEKDVLQVLSDYGFEVVSLEKLSIEQQISIFRNAKVVVGPHGAGLTNLTFSRPGTKIIEFIPSSYINPLYYFISKLADLEYYCLVGEGKKHPDYQELNISNFDNVIVDIDKLRKVLCKAACR